MKILPRYLNSPSKMTDERNVCQQEVDFALTGLSVTDDRATVSDHTIGFYHDNVALMTSLPEPSPVGWTFLIRPLHWHLYLLLGCCFVVLTCVFVWIERRSIRMTRSKRNDMSRMENDAGSGSVMHVAEALSGTLLGRGK